LPISSVMGVFDKDWILQTVLSDAGGEFPNFLLVKYGARLLRVWANFVYWNLCVWVHGLTSIT
ncbi:MAG: hypothetical protein PHQ36_07790, partial [Anaerolineales bacterium]|nr:hypothetical protein [Anaerolineales bacterium]